MILYIQVLNKYIEITSLSLIKKWFNLMLWQEYIQKIGSVFILNHMFGRNAIVSCNVYIRLLILDNVI